jgi:hypothetical protein
LLRIHDSKEQERSVKWRWLILRHCSCAGKVGTIWAIGGRRKIRRVDSGGYGSMCSGAIRGWNATQEMMEQQDEGKRRAAEKKQRRIREECG